MTKEQRRILQEVHDGARKEFVMILSDECERVLTDIFETVRPKRVLEIGAAIGYSSGLMATLSDCKIDTVEKDAERVKRAKELWQKLGVEQSITIYCGDSDDILPDIVKGKTYDFVFIDAAKSAYKRQLEMLLPHIEKDGIILCDDVLYLGLVKGEAYPPHKHRTIVRNMRDFLSYIQSDGRLESRIIEEGNGIAVIKKLI